jgi:hypothetical protein
MGFLKDQTANKGEALAIIHKFIYTLSVSKLANALLLYNAANITIIEIF